MPNGQKKLLTIVDPIDKMQAELRFRAAQIGHGNLRFELKVEIHDGTIKQIELEQGIQTMKFR